MIRKKIFVVLLSSLLVIGVGYFSLPIIQKENLKETPVIENSSVTKTETINTGVTQSGILHSSNAWGGNPFSTGTTHTGESLKISTKLTTSKTIHRVVFQKPNTEWKSRNITLQDGRTLNYAFGEGNPKEVELTAARTQQELRECEMSPVPLPRICQEGMSGYVTPELERALKNVLESPLWEQLVTRCESEYMRELDLYNRFNQNILAPHALDMSRFLLVDQLTGRKELVHIDSLVYALSSIGSNDMLYTGFEPCFDTNGGSVLLRMLSNILGTYHANIAYLNQKWALPSYTELARSLNQDIDPKDYILKP